MNPKPRLWWLCGSRITSTCAFAFVSSVSSIDRVPSPPTGRDWPKIHTRLENPTPPARSIRHRVVARASSRSRRARASRSRTSTTGPNCEKKFRTTPARARHHRGRRQSHRPRGLAGGRAERIPRSSHRIARGRGVHAPSSTVRSSPPTNIFDPAAASPAPMESPMVVDSTTDATRAVRAIAPRSQGTVAPWARDSRRDHDRWIW